MRLIHKPSPKSFKHGKKPIALHCVLNRDPQRGMETANGGSPVAVDADRPLLLDCRILRIRRVCRIQRIHVFATPLFGIRAQLRSSEYRYA